MKIDRALLTNIHKYFNPRVQVIGSAIFVDEGMLPEASVNDVDIMAEGSIRDQLTSFIEDNGYTSSFADSYSMPGTVEVTFEKYSMKKIHVCFYGDFRMGMLPEVFSTEELIKSKFERGTKSDLEQIIKVCSQRLMDKRYSDAGAKEEEE